MEIDDKLEPLTVHNYEVSPAMHNLIMHVLKTIPDEYMDDFPSFSVYENSPWGAHVEKEGVIHFDPSLLDLPTDIAIGTVAHEFAHLFLGHTCKGVQEDYEADELACRWGFSAEVEAMRRHYGPPTDGRI